MRFTIRDLLWLTVLCMTAVACLVIGFWLGDLRRQAVVDQENWNLIFRVQRLEISLREAELPLPSDND